MLKALELSGFKSFADRTRFEFPRGISIVVGPNGSGKSNLVDAVKWVLGSQSAKSLRGQEMVDVIFNGSASRGPMGAAEATLTLDNAEGKLPIDAREVHVTRRVYRSGEGEYLINRQACRLRDIRELLAGTGITTEAYCIIEQGKVDALLQSSPRDRRVIFEEAAGISQFKAKKTAALRRLERVEQNLLRLSDIVDEVESRLRSVRNQAGKARRYRDSAERLQLLRTQIGLVDWRALTAQLAAREAQIAEVQKKQAARDDAIARLEAEVHDIERALDETTHRQRLIESAAAAAREQIVAHQVAIDNLQSRRGELQEEVARCRRQLAAMNSRAVGASQESRDSASQLRQAEAELAAAVAQLQEHLTSVQDSQSRLDTERDAIERIRAEHAEAMQAGTLLANQWTTLQAQHAAISVERDSQERQLAKWSQRRSAAFKVLDEIRRAERDSEAAVQICQATMRSAEENLAHVRGELSRSDRQHRQIDAQLLRIRERIAVLTELHERLEGLDGGVQEVLRQARESPDGPLGDVRGVVADLFHVDVDTAPLIEVALGERAQYIVLETADRLMDLLQQGELGILGRVGFLRPDVRMSATALEQVDLSFEPGVMGRADRFVEAAPELAALVRRLLGRTWLVDHLSTARRLSETAGRGLDFVTADGQLLSADGTIVVGPRQAVTGVLSRRSELRACHEQAADLAAQLTRLDEMHARWEKRCSGQEEAVATARAANEQALTQHAERRHQTAAARAEHDQASAEAERGAQQVQRLVEQHSAVASQMQSAAEGRGAAERLAATLHDAMQAHLQRLTILEAAADEARAAATERQVVAAKCEERVELLRLRTEQSERDQEERERALAETHDRLSSLERQLAELDAQLLSARQSLADLFLSKERSAADSAAVGTDAEELRRRRGELAALLRDERQQHAALQAQQHKLDVAANRQRHERQTLGERMKDDYGIDLGEAATAAGATSDSVADRAAVEREISELRNRINTIGAVNLEALDELDELESRFNRMSQQYRDLVDAKASLERIIGRINADSRQIFQTTLEAVRNHFQELFRRLFGGGEADIICDENEDVLECGIEIVARPPGKERCSISLLSGGEKTLTCVALLLAVFRNKPSPFCVLDEVDAALDEANIGRFVAVLRDFLSFTRFVVISHSKRTMAGADTLYGVTMEESGVSKRVAVRFEDVSEDGQIRPAALRAA